jgi:DNA-binding MurR/RpiR family transcriptional regulator
MSTRAKQLTKDIMQPAKGVGCKLDTDTYHGITTGLVAGRTVADLSESYGVSPSTVSVLRHRHFESIPDHKRRLALKMGMAAERSVDRILEKLEKDEVTASQASVIAGICTEKALMLLDQQPVTVVKHVSVKDSTIADILDRLPRANAQVLDSQSGA